MQAKEYYKAVSEEMNDLENPLDDLLEPDDLTRALQRLVDDGQRTQVCKPWKYVAAVCPPLYCSVWCVGVFTKLAFQIQIIMLQRYVN